MAQAKTSTKARRTAPKGAGKGKAASTAPEELLDETTQTLESEPASKKIGKMHETIEEHEEVFGADLKLDEEIKPVGEDDEEEASEESTLDDEELNPFGDKWEL